MWYNHEDIKLSQISQSQKKTNMVFHLHEVLIVVKIMESRMMVSSFWQRSHSSYYIIDIEFHLSPVRGYVMFGLQTVILLEFFFNHWESQPWVNKCIKNQLHVIFPISTFLRLCPMIICTSSLLQALKTLSL